MFKPEYFANFMKWFGALAKDKSLTEYYFTQLYNWNIRNGSRSHWRVDDMDAFYYWMKKQYELAQISRRIAVDIDVVPELEGPLQNIEHMPFQHIMFGMRMETRDCREQTRVSDYVLLTSEYEDGTTWFTPFVRFVDGGFGDWTPFFCGGYLRWDGEPWKPEELAYLSGFEARSEKPGYLLMSQVNGVSLDNEMIKANTDTIAAHGFDLISIMQLINCANVDLETVTPSRLKRTRAKKRGELLEAYHVIKLPHRPQRQYTGSGGGHHKSPAMHTRRGHYRRLPSDHSKRVWVRPCVVGSIEDGLVRADYSVTKKQEN